MLAKHKLADPWHNKTKEKDGWLPTKNIIFFLASMHKSRLTSQKTIRSVDKMKPTLGLHPQATHHLLKSLLLLQE